MASNWSSLGIRLMTTGENDNTWGTNTNYNWQLIGDVADGYISVALASTTHTAAWTAQPTTYVDEEARQRVINYTGTPGGTCTITYPNIEKVYVIRNNTNQSLILTAGTGAATVTLAATYDAMVYCDGSDEIHNCFDQMAGGFGTMAYQAASSVSITGGSVSGITDLTVADGGTGSSNAADARTALGVTAANLSLGTSNNVQFNGLGVGTAGAAGEVRATGNITAYYSSPELKDFQGVIPDAVDKVNKLNGYYFYENQTAKDLGYDNDRLQVGINAEEVQAVLPEVVTEAPIDAKYKTVWYEKMVPLLIEAIKELSKDVRDLKKEV